MPRVDFKNMLNVICFPRIMLFTINKYTTYSHFHHKYEPAALTQAVLMIFFSSQLLIKSICILL